MTSACSSHDELEDGELEDAGSQLRGHGGIYDGEMAGDDRYTEAVASFRTMVQERRRDARVGGAWEKELAHLVSVAGETWKGRVCDCGPGDTSREDALHGRFFGEKVYRRSPPINCFLWRKDKMEGEYWSIAL